MNGFDRVANGEDNWFHGSRSLSPTPEEFVASLWSEVNVLRDAVSMPEGDRFSPRAKSFTKETGKGAVNSANVVDKFTATMTDEECAILKRLVEKRSREAAQMTVPPVSTVQHCIPRSPNPEMWPDVWRVTRVRWTQSETSSNHHRLVRVLKHPDSSVTRSGRQDEPPPTAS